MPPIEPPPIETALPLAPIEREEVATDREDMLGLKAFELPPRVGACPVAVLPRRMPKIPGLEKKLPTVIGLQ
jgi:hypothetical protein